MIDPQDQHIINYMRHRVPITVITLLAMMNRYVFTELDPDNCNDSNKATVIIVFVLLGLFDIVWTVKQCQIDFLNNYPHTGHKWILYAAIQAFTGVWTFYSFNYYIHKGVPFNCFFSYNSVKAEICFYVSFILIASVSYLEHYHWKKIRSTLSLYSLEQP